MAVGSLLQTYLSRFGVSTEGMSVETIGFASALDAVARVDPDVAKAVLGELVDQRTHLKLIASENYASPAVLLAMGNWLSDKYAEGAPGHRLYAGCDNVDTVESRADELACSLFGADHAYAQPHSGIDANLVAFWAVLSQRVESPALERLATRHVNDLSDEDWEALRHQLGNQTLFGMSLQAGGHLTHGFRPNISREAVPQPLLWSRSRDVSVGLRRDQAAGARGGAVDPDRGLQLLSAARELPGVARDRR